MKKREFHLGPGAASLMLVAVVLAMSILGLLSMMSARSDLRIARRSADVARMTAALDAQSEESLAALDGLLASCAAQANNDESYISLVKEGLPGGMVLQNRTVFWTETGDEGRKLECGAEIAPLGADHRLEWSVHRHYAELEGDYLP